MANFLSDKTFLLKIMQHRISEHWAAISVLDFEKENILANLEGKVISGNMSIAANSNTRRTGSLSIVFDEDTLRLTDTKNLISIDKKISLSIGITNPYFETLEYKKYGKILWFKQGTFIITQASSSISASGATVSINFIDKMGYLNGTCGGILPASTSFHDRYIDDGKGHVTVTYPLISEIIKEAVNHFGAEHASRIIVEDVDDVGRQVARYVGETPISFATHPVTGAALNNGSFIISSDLFNPNFQDHYYKNDIIGYLETDLTYPGDLIKAAGAKVTDVLDDIVNTLGNYEYFYDVEGDFHFRKKPNFLATGKTPLNLTQLQDSGLNEYYTPKFSNYSYVNEFSNTNLVASVNYNPNYSNIKNDYVIWGTKNNEHLVRYHLAIDERPKEIKPGTEISAGDYSLCYKNIWSVLDQATDAIIRYTIDMPILKAGEKMGLLVAPDLSETFKHLDPIYWFNWREELYRKALIAYGTSTRGSYYDEELLAEWRKIYDPGSTIERVGATSFEKLWNDYFENENIKWYGYTKDAINDPQKLSYWLDIIETNSTIGRFSVNNIGRRTLVEENTTIDTVFNKEINDIVFIKNTKNSKLNQEKIQYYRSIGQVFAFLTQDQLELISTSNSNASCYEILRERLYNNLIYNSNVSLTCTPIFYLDVNQVVLLNFPELGIQGHYIINNISWELGNTSTMRLSLNEAITIA